jgi:hypothetical protein
LFSFSWHKRVGLPLPERLAAIGPQLLASTQIREEKPTSKSLFLATNERRNIWANSSGENAGDAMRATLLTLTIVMAGLPPRSFARDNFKRFDTLSGEHRCACIGMASCSEMKSSGNCHSDAVCDQDQPGAIICSSNAWRTSRPTSLN